LAAGASLSKNIGMQELATSSRLQADSMTLQIGGPLASHETIENNQNQAKAKKSGMILGSAALKNNYYVT